MIRTFEARSRAVASQGDRFHLAPTDAYADPPNDGESDLANSPNVGADYDYANQNYTDEGLAEGTTAVPMGIYAPGYPALSPAPMMVSPNLVGPGSYQQWASGPGTFFSKPVRGPGFFPRTALRVSSVWLCTRLRSASVPAALAGATKNRNKAILHAGHDPTNAAADKARQMGCR